MPLSTINSNSFSTTANTNIDNGLLFLDVTNNRVGVRQTAPRHSLDVTSGEVGLRVTGSDTGYTHGAILLQSDTISTPQSRGQGVFLFNEGTDVNWYSGTFYTDADAWGVSRKAGASFDSSVADPASRVFKIDSSGRVTTPSQPCFHGIGSGTQSFSGSAAYQVLQIANQNTSIPAARRAGYSTSTYRYTAPVAGSYHFYARITATSAATGPEFYFVINGSSFFFGAIGYLYSGGYSTVSSSVVLALSANDYVDVRVINNNSTTFDIDLGRSAFGGHLLG